MELFEKVFKYKLIYIFSIDDKAHEGLLKIGDATIDTNESVEMLTPNCKLLNDAARDRINVYTNTAGITYTLLHTELAIRITHDKNGKEVVQGFRDLDVHEVLSNSGINKYEIKGTNAKEWFKTDLNTAVKAIDSVKKGFKNLSNSVRNTKNPIIFRPEQEEAIDKTIKRFKTSNKMLWNAKMRFGKTICTLEVIKRSKFKKSIIITHRPVVDDGWYEDFNKIFDENDNYVYGSKNHGYTVEELEKLNKNYIYFASMQDLRGSNTVGGKYDKNNKVFDINWDFVIVDEAHEGTTTALGDDVIKHVVKDENNMDTKFLALSGTPFNILREYEKDSIYTWDYIMEQSAKHEWDLKHFGDFNPYEDLPELKIFTYDLGKILKNKNYVEIEDKAFNFREFFRTWTGDVSVDHSSIPDGAKIGDFVHEKDVVSFINLISKESEDSNYPFSKKEYRDLFRHSLWMLPGVKEARALSKVLKNNAVFGMGFEIVNVAGEGDDEVKQDDALKMVREAIDRAGDNGYTITLSCGKLTTGVTVKEWTAVMMLSGSYSTSAANYLQTIFRVQSPCNKNGKMKTSAYVFDFAPDRTLKMVAESVAISTKAGKTHENDRVSLGKFLNFCPVISIDGTEMKKYNTNKLLQQLKRAYAERVVQNGFDDTNIYNEELLKLNDIDLKAFEHLKGIIGISKAAAKTNEINVNNQGFTEEEYEELERIQKKKKSERTPEEQALLDEKNEKNKIRRDAISVLRGLSIRMPLLIYGADVPLAEDITIEELADLVDDLSWKEFMPAGVTKEEFKKFIKFYDPEIFITAGRRIRNITKGADELAPLERVKQIADLFSCFKNPDKETVLTPWRVVNMHMSDCLGGYKFYDDKNIEKLETPNFINQGAITCGTITNTDAKILEINSKTGLYPLYITYSIFKSKCDKYKPSELTLEFQQKLWFDTVEKNIFVICNTPMAKSITQRTLLGFNPDKKVNAHYFEDLVNYMKNKSDKFVERVTRESYWGKGDGKMKFDAIIGNPPYNQIDGGGGSSSTPIYKYFVETSKKLKPEYISMIIPSRWMTGGKGLDDFRRSMMNDLSIRVLHDYIDARECFNNVNIEGGVCYFVWDKNNQGPCEMYNHNGNGEVTCQERILAENSDIDVVIRDERSIKILEKVQKLHENSFSSIVFPRNAFKVGADYESYICEEETDTKMLCRINNVRNKVYVNDRNFYSDKNNLKPKYKLFVSKADGAAGQLGNPIPAKIIGNAEFGYPGDICTETFLTAGPFENKECMENASKYLKTKFARFMIGIRKNKNMTADTYKFLPMQDFHNNQSIDWSKKVNQIDRELYLKYNLDNNEIDYIESMIKNI